MSKSKSSSLSQYHTPNLQKKIWCTSKGQLVKIESTSSMKAIDCDWIWFWETKCPPFSSSFFWVLKRWNPTYILFARTPAWHFWHRWPGWFVSMCICDMWLSQRFVVNQRHLPQDKFLKLEHVNITNWSTFLTREVGQTSIDTCKLNIKLQVPRRLIHPDLPAEWSPQMISYV